MCLFVQNINLNLSKKDYLVEKVSLPKLSKSKVNVRVSPGTSAIINGKIYRTGIHKFMRDDLGAKGATPEVYLIPERDFESVNLPVFGGNGHYLAIDMLPDAKGRFAIVGDATVEVKDYADLAVYFNKTVTRQQLIDELNDSVRRIINNAVNTAACKFISENNPTYTAFGASVDKIASGTTESANVRSALFNMGLKLSSRGVSLKLNPLDERAMQAIQGALIDKALTKLDDDVREREAQEREAERQHELDMERARNTAINESTETKNINTNGNGKVVINNGKNSDGARKGYCPNCGEKIDSSKTKFCPRCGEKL